MKTAKTTAVWYIHKLRKRCISIRDEGVLTCYFFPPSKSMDLQIGHLTV